MTTPAFSALHVTNDPLMQQEFITRMVNSCPPRMMLTELVRNGIQAEHDHGDVRMVRIFERLVLIPNDELTPDLIAKAKALPEYGYKVTKEGVWVPKLAIWNTGKGMDAERLRRITNLGQTEGKAFGTKHSYGIGAKVAALGRNPLGVRYQSCTNGVVSQTILALGSDPVTGTTFYAHKLENGQAVYDVTDQVTKENKTVKPIPANPYLKTPAQQDVAFLRSTNAEWTEVVLMGSHPLQQTAMHPDHHIENFYLIGATNEPRYWIGDDLWQRWYDLATVVRRALPDNRQTETPEVSIDVSIRLLRAPLRSRSENIKTSGFRTFRPITDSFDAAKWKDFYTERETVTTSDGTVIHYGYDASDVQQHYQLGDTRTMFAVAHRGELFEIERYGAPRDGRRWSLVAPKFGITEPSLAKHVSIIVRLPDSFPVGMSDNRDYLDYDATSEPFRHEDIAAVVRDNMPEWLRKLNEPKDSNLDQKLDDYMRNLLKELLKDAPPPQGSTNGSTTPTFGGNQRNPNSGGTGKSSSTSRANNTPQIADPNALPSLRPPALTIPTRRWVTGDDAVSQGIENRFARYERSVHVIYLNPEYRAMAVTIQKIRDALPDILQTDPEKAGTLIMDATKTFYEKVIAHYVLRMIVRRYSQDLDGWDEAAHPTALTTMVDCADNAVRDIINSIKSGEFKATYLSLIRPNRTPTSKAS